MADSCILSAAGYGVRKVTVTMVNESLKFDANQSEARFHRTLYPLRLETGGFGITIVCSSHREYEATGKWLQGYCRMIADPYRSTVALRVNVPARRFVRNGVPKGPITFGDKVDAITYTHTLEFVAVEDPVAFNSPLLSSFRLGAHQKDTTEHFYPAGNQEDAEDRAREAFEARNYYDTDYFLGDVNIVRPAQDLTGSDDRLPGSRGVPL